MIYTCTPNPAIDYKIELESITYGGLNRFSNSRFLAGGKGINVSIALKKLGIESVCTGFIGGFTGSFIQSELANKYAIVEDFVHVKQDTRVNIKITGNPTETELNHDGNQISNVEKELLLAKIKRLKPEDILICGGSTAKGQPLLYQEIARLCQQHQIRFVMDTPGNYMSQFLEYHPFLIKPNLVELKEFFGQEIKEMSEFIHYGQKLIESGAEHVLISMGAEGSILLTKNHIYRASTLDYPVKNTVGAGDSMVAGFVLGYQKTNDIIEAYRSAVALASATTFGNELADPNLYRHFLDSIRIQEIHGSI